MKIRPGQFYLLHADHVVEVKKIEGNSVTYLIDGCQDQDTVSILKFECIIERLWVLPRIRIERREKWTTSI